MPTHNKFKFLKNNTNVLDLGSFPGGWCQVAKEKNKNGKILGLDKKTLDQIQGVNLLKGDFLEEVLKTKIFEYFDSDIDVILADMAADTTGNKSLDCIRTNQLCIEVLDFSKKILKSNGVVISKLFMGTSFNEIVSEAKKIFKEVSIFKPPSSRKDSKESFIICKILR